MTLRAIHSEIRLETNVREVYPNYYSSKRAIHRREQPHNTSRTIDANTVADRLNEAVLEPLESPIARMRI